MNNIDKKLLELNELKKQLSCISHFLGNNYNNFCKAIYRNDIELAYQIILGNIVKLNNDRYYHLDINKIEKLANGIGIEYFSNGGIYRQFHYSKSILEGICLIYRKNGSIRIKSHYHKGLLEGECITYKSNGKICKKSYYHKGKLVNEIIIENKNIKLDEKDLEILFQENNYPTYNLFKETYTNIFFEFNECAFLDNFRANIDLLDNKYKRSLAFAIMNRSMTRKVTMGHFCHTQALNYDSNPERIKRNRSLVRPIKDIFWDLLPKYSNSIFDNKQDNISYNLNALDLIPNLKNVDLAYFDPPYCNSHANYQSFYHLLETYTEYWKDKKFVNGTKRYEPQLFSGFDKKRDVLNSFEILFKISQDIPYWIISYNDRSYPDIDSITRIISKYREFEIQTKLYHYGRGGKGSVAGSREILIICKPKKQICIKKII